jgi:type I restriction enzyme R subunit
MLVDESHRTNFGSFSARMRQMFPDACYIGFTGTPLLKKEKSSFLRFGGLIEPHYSIRQAVDDGAVVPLLYEGRHVEMSQNREAIDLWFERHTEGLTSEQKTDLKRKYARAEMLNKADQVIYMRAFDISEHYRQNWKGSGFKAQLVAPSKISALKYRDYLNEIGYVSSEVIISPPDMREGFDETDDEESKDEVVKFWQKMMRRYGKEDKYTQQLINQFKNGDEPEILIVVDKLLTGFDAPRNTVLYLCRMLREHTLLQAIARVNRLFEHKDFGYIIDYASVLGELDKAMTMYDALAGFDEVDLAGTLTSADEEIGRLPQRHSDLWDLFRTVRNSYDEEDYERLLQDEKLRQEFYRRLYDYSKTLAIALSNEDFLRETASDDLLRYKNDLKRFHKLRVSVKNRYAERVDYRDYEPKIKKLLDTHIQAHEVTQLNEPVNIFDEVTFGMLMEERGVYKEKTPATRADMIAHATKKEITERLDQDPAFYVKFSQLIQQAIDDFRAQRISDLEYLEKIRHIRDNVVHRKHDDVPAKLQNSENAMAIYGVVRPMLTDGDAGTDGLDSIAADTALAVQDIFSKYAKVQFWEDDDAQNRVINDIDDYLFDEVKGKSDIDLSLEQIDEMLERVMTVARNRRMP